MAASAAFRFEYAHVAELVDPPHVTAELWDVVLAWLTQRGSGPSPAMLKRHDGMRYTGAHYNNDVEIASLGFMRSEGVRSFFEHIDCSGGIFIYRWGCPVRSMAVWALLPESKVRHLADLLSYAHQSFHSCVAPTHHSWPEAGGPDGSDGFDGTPFWQTHNLAWVPGILVEPRLCDSLWRRHPERPPVVSFDLFSSG